MEMGPALAECRRVLKEGGRAAFVEPVYRPGAYTEVTRLVEEEGAAQEKAYAAIRAQAALGLAMEAEEFFFLERSFADYERLVDFFVDDSRSPSGDRRPRPQDHRGVQRRRRRCL